MKAHSKRILITLGLAAAILVVIYAGVVYLTGDRLGPRRFPQAVLSLGRAVLSRPAVLATSRGEYTNILFQHHSVGSNLIVQGQVRERLAHAGYSFWDNGYNSEGLRDPHGQPANYTYWVAGDNTDIEGYANSFQQPVFALPVNALSAWLQHEVIIFKSCFPNSAILSDAQLAADQAAYRQMRQVMDRYPDKLFILVTQPPLNPAETNPDAAARARALADWLASDEFLAGHPNLATYNFFAALAENDPAAPDANMLRQAYRDGTDSHPNRAANEAIGPAFVEFILKTIENFRLAQKQG